MRSECAQVSHLHHPFLHLVDSEAFAELLSSISWSFYQLFAGLRRRVTGGFGLDDGPGVRGHWLLATKTPFFGTLCT